MRGLFCGGLIDMNFDSKYVLEIIKKQIDNKYICPEIKYAFESSISALEKQIPEMPTSHISHDKINHWYECGQCKYIVSKITDKYCPHCGQKIEWKEE